LENEPTADETVVGLIVQRGRASIILPKLSLVLTSNDELVRVTSVGGQLTPSILTIMEVLA